MPGWLGRGARRSLSLENALPTPPEQPQLLGVPNFLSPVKQHYLTSSGGPENPASFLGKGSILSVLGDSLWEEFRIRDFENTYT